MFIFAKVYIYVDFSFPTDFLSLFLYRAVMFIRCYLSIPHIILSVIVNVNGVFKTNICFFTFDAVWKITTYKSSEKCCQKVNKASQAHLYKWKFVYWCKEKRNIGTFTTQLIILWYEKKSTPLVSNGMAAIPKKDTKVLKNN